MAKSPPQHPMGIAMQWVARIVAAGLMMVLPGLAGQWLDKKLGLDERLGAGFLVLVGFALGITFSIWYLIAITKPKSSEPEDKK